MCVLNNINITQNKYEIKKYELNYSPVGLIKSFMFIWKINLKINSTFYFIHGHDVGERTVHFQYMNPQYFILDTWASFQHKKQRKYLDNADAQKQAHDERLCWNDSQICDEGFIGEDFSYQCKINVVGRS